MNITMFIIGFCIFSVYIYFTIWSIFYNAKKNKEENYPSYHFRYNQVDNMDIDGMGNFSRFPKRKKTTLKKKQHV